MTVASIASTTASGTSAPVARDGFSVFQASSSANFDPEIADLADYVSVDAADRGRFRVLGTRLGRFHSRLVAFPARSGRNVCYSLLGERLTDPGMSYCYQPRGVGLPAGLAGQRFSAVALQSVTAGQLGTQLFGVAEDSVVAIRVEVAGSWRQVPTSNNGFYLDLPDTSHSQAGIVEATLASGDTQVHDLQLGS